jgi:HD-GYP domain-containing protein (c-di-GMP phosphodiesterase class II)
MGDFADLASPYLLGHSSGVGRLALAAARRCDLDASELVAVRRAALVHDLGRVGVPARVWQSASRLTADDSERIRPHAYHTERFLARSELLAPLGSIAALHHERLDGSGYHRGSVAPALPFPARVLAAADAYQAMTEPRAHRRALTSAQAAVLLGEEARTGRLDADAVTAVLASAGQPTPPRPAGLTERECEVVGLLARGLQTKQIAVG